MTAAVITAALFFFVISLHLRTRQRTHFHAPTIQTNSFCFGSNSYIYVRVFLQISASLHDNAKLARVGVARAAPAHGLTELFLIKYFALLYVRSNITLHDPFLRIIIWTT